MTKRRQDDPAKGAPQRYDFPEADIETAVAQIRELLRSHAFLTLGPHGEAFELAFAAYSGVKHAVAVNSGTAALEIILRAVDVLDAEVIVPTNTFAASAFAVVHAGGRVVFADCDDDLCADADDVERKITPATKAIVTVHIGGLISPSVQRLRDLCDRNGLVLIEDAAHAHGSDLNGLRAGNFGVAAAYSFFSTKVMTTGEGGMVVTNDDRMANTARLLRDQAKASGQNRHEFIGYNWRMPEFQAILGSLQLARLDEFIKSRKRVAAIYDELFGAASDRLAPVTPPPGTGPNYYKYILMVDSPERAARIGTTIKARHGVSLGGAVYDLPCHEQPVFSHLNTPRLPRAESLCRRHICPPIYPSLTDDEAIHVARAILEAAT